MSRSVKILCWECFEVVLAKALYAHIVIRHSRLPASHEVPERFLPLPAARRRLQPHVDKIVSDFVETSRRQAELAARGGPARIAAEAYYEQLMSYGDAACTSK
jgi:hypothetical protein